MASSIDDLGRWQQFLRRSLVCDKIGTTKPPRELRGCLFSRLSKDCHISMPELRFLFPAALDSAYLMRLADAEGTPVGFEVSFTPFLWLCYQLVFGEFFERGLVRSPPSLRAPSRRRLPLTQGGEGNLPEGVLVSVMLAQDSIISASSKSVLFQLISVLLNSQIGGRPQEFLTARAQEVRRRRKDFVYGRRSDLACQ